jgi:hypothetical protein
MYKIVNDQCSEMRYYVHMHMSTCVVSLPGQVVFFLSFFSSFGQVMMMTRLGSRAKHLRSEFHGFRRVARAQAASQPPKPKPRRRSRPPGKAKLLSGCFPGEHNSTTQMNHDMDVFATGDGRGRGRARQDKAGPGRDRQGKARQSKADGRAATGGLGHPSVECVLGATQRRALCVLGGPLPRARAAFQ